MKRPAVVGTAFELGRIPGVKVEMSGHEECRALFSSFTRRHPRLKVIQSKRWGVALLEIPDQFDDYFRDPQQAHLRREFNRASRAGMTFGTVDSEARFEEILGINRSAETRQGLPMHPHYLDEANVRRYFERSTDVFGVTDADGVLKATSASGSMARSRAGAHSRPRRRSQVGSDVGARHRDDSGTCGAEAGPGLSEMVRVRHVSLAHLPD